jgi:ATP-dependent Zn protease
MYIGVSEKMTNIFRRADDLSRQTVTRFGMRRTSPIAYADATPCQPPFFSFPWLPLCESHEINEYKYIIFVYEIRLSC